jgi:putative ABC transport system ATP-binding protein
MKLLSVIKLEGIKKVYQSGEQLTEVLRHIDLTINKGEFVSLMGSSGAGKSTLMNIIGLLDQASAGQYLLNGEDVSFLDDDSRSRIRNQQIGFVFQSFYLLPKLTALQNVLLPTLYHPEAITDAEDRAMQCLEKVGVAHLFHHRPNQLSGGQQQRVAIARALMCAPSVILADEPTGALDSKTSQEVMALFLELNQKEQVTVIIVTHDSFVAAQCERVIHIKDGRVEE